MKLKPKDELFDVFLGHSSYIGFIVSKNGQAIKFKLDEIRAMGRGASGVRGIRLKPNDEVADFLCVDEKELDEIIILMEKGYGKRSDIEDYRKTSRGGKGVINLKVNDKTGEVIGSLSVGDKDSVIATTKNGMVLRVNMKDLRVMGRATQGVHVVRLKDNDKLADIVMVPLEENIPESEQRELKV